MKRDLDLCREILRRLEAHDPSSPPSPRILRHLHPSRPKIEGHSDDEVRYHLEIMYEAGLVWSQTKEVEKSLEGADYSTRHAFRQSRGDEAYRLTWAGHEFLDAARNDTLWNNAKRTVKSKTGGLAFEFVKAVLVSLGKEAIGLR